MTCQDCQKAAENPSWGGFTANCMECSCRALASGPDAWKAIKGLTNAPLQNAMQVLAGYDSEKYKHIRARVWYWIGQMKEPAK